MLRVGVELELEVEEVLAQVAEVAPGGVVGVRWTRLATRMPSLTALPAMPAATLKLRTARQMTTFPSRCVMMEVSLSKSQVSILSQLMLSRGRNQNVNHHIHIKFRTCLKCTSQTASPPARPAGSKIVT